MAESVEINILRSIAAIYRSKENFDKSLEFLERAKAINSSDINLILLESNIRWEMGEVDMYQTLISKALEIEPNNVDLIFNLGVVNADKGNTEAAIEYYDKAIEMDPTYTKAYLNAAALTLEKEGAIIEEMNSLGMSTADYNRYDELKIDRENLYKSAIPYLEKVYELDNNNLNAVRTLKNIFSALGDIDSENKYKKIAAELEVQ
jgi:tetratricopeptide (TPR) repeat protein